jgi:hypothetical protein
MASGFDEIFEAAAVLPAANLDAPSQWPSEVSLSPLASPAPLPSDSWSSMPQLALICMALHVGGHRTPWAVTFAQAGAEASVQAASVAERVRRRPV